MGIFSDIVNAIFSKAKAAGSAIAEAASTAASAAGGAPKPQPMSRQDVEAMIQKIADSTGRKNYNW